MFIYTPITKLTHEQVTNIRNHKDFKTTMVGDCYGIFSGELSMWFVDSEGVEVSYEDLMEAAE